MQENQVSRTSLGAAFMRGYQAPYDNPGYLVILRIMNPANKLLKAHHICNARRTPSGSRAITLR